MGEVIPFPVKNTHVAWGQLAQAIEQDIASEEVLQNTSETQLSVFQKLFPQYFMTPGEIVVYLEDIRQKQQTSLENKPLLEQVSQK